MEHVFITVGIITAISAILALLMTVANKTVNDYGEVKITINEEKTLDVRGGSTLLSLLVDNEIFIPFACGGKEAAVFVRRRSLMERDRFFRRRRASSAMRKKKKMFGSVVR